MRPPPYALLLVLTVTMGESYAADGDLAALDAAGRRIAEHPCTRPKVSVKVEKNVHDESVTDRFIALTCPRSASEIVRSSISRYKDVIPLVASVSGTESWIPSPFAVGSQIAIVKARLGTPEVETAESVTYLLPSETREERISFIHDGLKVKEIQWSWYFD